MKPLIKRILKEQVDYSNFCLPIKGWGGSAQGGQIYGACRGKKCSRKHGGIDLSDGNKSGDNLYAPEDGTITKSHFFTPWDNSLCSGCSEKDKVAANKANGYNGCGGFLRIKHANGVETKHCHLKRIDVSKGETVTKGQVIGLTGGNSAENSPSGVDDKGRGNSSNAHLHYEVLVNDNQVNPDPDFVRNGECGDPVDDIIVIDDVDPIDNNDDNIIHYNPKRVRFIQELLFNAGYLEGDTFELGLMEVSTIDAIKDLQDTHGITPTGIVDAPTFSQLIEDIKTSDKEYKNIR